MTESADWVEVPEAWVCSTCGQPNTEMTMETGRRDRQPFWFNDACGHKVTRECLNTKYVHTEYDLDLEVLDYDKD